jgi:hypothetical protein
MNNKDYATAVIVGSYITYLISLTDKSSQTTGSSIRLRDMITKVTRASKDMQLVGLANKSWDNVLTKHKDEQLTISPAVTIESLYFSFERQLQELYGQHIAETVLRYVEKQQKGNVSKYAKDSYIAADSLRDELRKVIFEEFKNG